MKGLREEKGRRRFGRKAEKKRTTEIDSLRLAKTREKQILGLVSFFLVTNCNSVLELRHDDVVGLRRMK